jgi:uncharacterized membrane protein (DUF485 family)
MAQEAVMAKTDAGRGPAGAGAAPTSDIWERVAAMDEFKQLLRKKAAFVVPATIFFIVYYFLLPISVGYFPGFMDKKVIGAINLAYVFALSQFFVSWAIAWLYVRAAKGFDESAAGIIQKVTREKGGN